MTSVSIRPSLRNLKFSPTLLINEEVSMYRRQGYTVYHMGFGESPFPVHPVIQEAIAGYSGKNQYLPAAGLNELRFKARDHILKKHRIEAADFDVMIGPGSKELIFDIQLAIDGDLLFPAPSWVSYIPQTLITRDEVVRIPLGPEEAYKLSGERLERSIVESTANGRNPTKLILNYPNNPTGMTYSADELEAIADVCRRHGILVISDEIYAQVSFRWEHRSIAHFYPEGTIVTTGLSKHLSLGGFRLGIALVPRRLDAVFEVLRSIASETFSAVSTPIQYSVMAAFEENDEIERYIAECTSIHDIVTRYVWRGIRRLGVDYGEPQGGFYLYPDFGAYREGLAAAYSVTTSEDLARHLLRTRSVATLPGTAFGDEPDDLRLRLSTVDFDGLWALERYRADPPHRVDTTAVSPPRGGRGAGDEWDERDDAFVEAACPRVVEGCTRLVEYFEGAKRV
jgi:aspartate aminotransferase